MISMLQWPDDFSGPPECSLGPSFVAFLEEMYASGVTVLADNGWSIFEFRRGERSIFFIRRGRSATLNGIARMNRETYWEVCPVQNEVAHYLGPLFGTRKFACVVVCGVPDIRLITMRWLDGVSLVESVNGATLWDRCDPSTPLQLVI